MPDQTVDTYKIIGELYVRLTVMSQTIEKQNEIIKQQNEHLEELTRPEAA